MEITFATVLPFLYWLFAGVVAGLVSGGLRARSINVAKVGGHFEFGATNINNLIGGVAGLAAAYVVFGFNYYGGLVYMIPLFLAWIPAEIYFRDYLVARFSKNNGV